MHVMNDQNVQAQACRRQLNVQVKRQTFKFPEERSFDQLRFLSSNPCQTGSGVLLPGHSFIKSICEPRQACSLPLPLPPGFSALGHCPSSCGPKNELPISDLVVLVFHLFSC